MDRLPDRIRRDTITAKAWEVFRSAFKDGEQVIIEDWDGDFHRGKLACTKDGVTLTRPDGRSDTLEWEEVIFICHDGFPVKHIIGMSERQAAALADKEPCEIIIRALEGKLKPRPATPRYFGGGCPFVAGPCDLIEIHNRGNRGPEFWPEARMDGEEVLVFQADDGARMHSYDSSHLFLKIP